MKVLILLCSLLMLSACGSKEVVIVGEKGSAIESEKVVVFYHQKPDCEFSVVAHLKLNGGYFSRQSLIEAFRQKSAELGASRLQITHIQQSSGIEYLGSARALRCDPGSGTG